MNTNIEIMWQSRHSATLATNLMRGKVRTLPQWRSQDSATSAARGDGMQNPCAIKLRIAFSEAVEEFPRGVGEIEEWRAVLAHEEAFVWADNDAVHFISEEF